MIFFLFKKWHAYSSVLDKKISDEKFTPILKLINRLIQVKCLRNIFRLYLRLRSLWWLKTGPLFFLPLVLAVVLLTLEILHIRPDLTRNVYTAVYILSKTAFHNSMSQWLWFNSKSHAKWNSSWIDIHYSSLMQFLTSKNGQAFRLH